MNKQFFRIGEVSDILGVKTSVLRFWEGEFRQINPRKSSTGQRYYSSKHVDFLKKIKNMLYVEKYTIEGAKKRLSSGTYGQADSFELMQNSATKTQVTISPDELAPVFDAIFGSAANNEVSKISREQIKQELIEILEILK